MPLKLGSCEYSLKKNWRNGSWNTFILWEVWDIGQTIMKNQQSLLSILYKLNINVGRSYPRFSAIWEQLSGKNIK